MAIVSAPTNHQPLFAQHPIISGKPWRPNGSSSSISYPFKLTIPLCSSSSTSVVDEESSLPPDSQSALEYPNRVSLRGCKACGREDLEKGCNGEGRIQGGIATVFGFGWWPIKAYRPCPGFLASGGRYKRQGQSMDEVAFGRGESRPSGKTSSRNGESGPSVGTSTSIEVESSKKKQGPRKFKR